MSLPGPTVLVACDKFKGTLTAAQACDAVASGVRDIWPDAQCLLRPMADGGEGTAQVLCGARGGEWRTLSVTGPMGDPVTAGYAWLESEKTAVIEMSEASGLKLVPSSRRNPWRASTRGTGELMRAAVEAGARRIIVGIGGSATNDGGSGMAWALGYKFLNAEGEELVPVPANLAEVVRIERPAELNLPAVTAACDVTNPLLGAEGASAVYGPQKGVRLERVADFEGALAHLAELVKRDLGCDHTERPGAGAAGGLGFGLMSFCGADTRSGFDLVAEVTSLEQAVREADLVITGEGCLDGQTLHGKGPICVADMARRLGKPVAAVGGIVDAQASQALHTRFHIVISAASEKNLAEAMARPAEFVRASIPSRKRDFLELMEP